MIAFNLSPISTTRQFHGKSLIAGLSRSISHTSGSCTIRPVSLFSTSRCSLRFHRKPQCKPLDFDSPDGNSSGGKRNNGGPLCAEGDDNHYPYVHQSTLWIPYVAFAISKRYLFNASQKSSSRQSTSLASLLKRIRISHILLAINIAIFACQALFAPGLLMAGAKVNAAIAGGEYYRLFSPMFVHASTTHLLINSFSLQSTGPSVESWFGKRRFLILYITSGLCGNFLSYLCTPSPAVGASGAIFGLVGASAVMLARHNRLLGPRARRGLRSLVYIVVTNFGMGLTPGSRIDNFGHLGGFLGGIMYSFLFGPRLMIRHTRNGRAVIYDEPVIDLALRRMRANIQKFPRVFDQK